MSLEYLRRNEGLVTRVQQDFNKSTSGRCTISDSTIQGATKSEIFGVTASSNIEAGTRLYEECTLLMASSDSPISMEKSRTYNVCEFLILFCRNKRGSFGVEVALRRTAMSFVNAQRFETYHRVLCGKDFGWLYDVATGGKQVAKDKAVEGALWLRILALCVQEGCHPLERHLIARLTSLYQGDTAMLWSTFWQH